MYVSCQSCHIYGTWRNKEVGEDVLKSSFVVGSYKQGDNFLLEGSPYVILLFWDLFCKFYWLLWKPLWDTSLQYITAIIPVLCLLRYKKSVPSKCICYLYLLYICFLDIYMLPIYVTYKVFLRLYLQCDLMWT